MTSRSGRSGNTLLNARNVIGFAFIALCSAPAFASSGIGASSSENPDAASTDTLAAELDGHGIARSDIIQAGMSASLNSPDTEITSLSSHAAKSSFKQFLRIVAALRRLALN